MTFLPFLALLCLSLLPLPSSALLSVFPSSPSNAPYNLTNWDTPLSLVEYSLTSLLYPVNFTGNCLMDPPGPLAPSSTASSDIVVIIKLSEGLTHCTSYSQMCAALDSLKAKLIVVVGVSNYDNSVDENVLPKALTTFLIAEDGAALFALAAAEPTMVIVTNSKCGVKKVK